MPRSTAPKKSAVTPYRPAPPPAPHFPTPTAPTFSQTIKEGVGLGIGSSIGHRITSAFFGPPTIATTAVAAAPQQPCASKDSLEKAFNACVQQHLSAEPCQKELNAYIACAHPVAK